MRVQTVFIISFLRIRGTSSTLQLDLWFPRRSGGYKLSSLEVESSLLTHPLVKEASVLGAPDPVWGEVVAAVVVSKGEICLEEVCVTIC